MSVKFGTDGWRAIIGKEYTFDNLSIVTQATARWIKDSGVTQNGVIIGHDARFMGREFSEHVACIFAAMEIPVRFAHSVVTTPALSWAALEYNAVGIVITASHNPPQYNGFKIKAPFGGPATPEQIAEVEKRYGQFDATLKAESFETYMKQGRIREIPLAEQFLNVLRERIDLKALQASGIKIAHDPMFGAGKGVIATLLPNQVVEIHNSNNPGFNGRAPEPIEKNLPELPLLVKEHGCAIGIANDGDADRVGLYDENGTFVDSHQVLSLLTRYLAEEKKLSGSIIKTFSTTTMLDKQAAWYKLPIETTPVGFKYVAEKIVTGDVMVGGEESGGLAVKGHIPERDGIYIGLLIAEMIVKLRKPLSKLVQELYDQFGLHCHYRNDMHTTNEFKDGMISYCKSQSLKEIEGLKVVDWQFTDGIKQILEDGSWVLLRASGTEPVLRIYSEANSAHLAKQLVDYTSNLVGKVGI